MRLTLVVPGLLDVPESKLADVRALARLARHARARRDARGLEHALLRACGARLDAGGDVPVAPLLALAAGVEPGNDFVFLADPVTLVATRDDVIVQSAVRDLARGSADALVGALNAHFASDGLRIEALWPDTWIARLHERPQLLTTPLASALGAPLRPSLPEGPDATRWRLWGTEAQMLLHSHPESEARDAAGLSPVNGLWFWGGGTLSDVGLIAPLRAHAAAGRAGDLLRGLAHHSGGDVLRMLSSFEAVVEAVPATRPASHVVVALPRLEDEAALDEVVGAWLQPALQRLERGSLTALTLVADGSSVAGTWSATSPGRLRRSLSRLRRARFALPSS